MTPPHLTELSPTASHPDHVLVLVRGYLSQDASGPEDSARWIDGFRRAGWPGRIVQLCWDASNKKGLLARPWRHWKEVVDRAVIVGREHARDLLGALPERHVTLVGYSLGARIVYETLVARGPSRIRDAILIGGAIDRDHKPPDRDWLSAASAVDHRLLTIGNREDKWMSRYRHRHGNPIAGTSPVGRKEIDVAHPNIEHFDATGLIDSGSHKAYPDHLQGMPFAAWWRTPEFSGA